MKANTNTISMHNFQQGGGIKHSDSKNSLHNESHFLPITKPLSPKLVHAYSKSLINKP